MLTLPHSKPDRADGGEWPHTGRPFPMTGPEALLATVMRSLGPPRMPPASLRVRLKTSPALRLLVPERLAVSRAQAKGRRLWKEGGDAHARARRVIATIVAGTEREGEAEPLAREWAIEHEVLHTVYWQPWRAPLLDAVSSTRMAEMLASRRGAIFSSCHLGPYNRTSLALLHRGYAPLIVTGAWYFTAPDGGEWGRRVARVQRSAKRSRLLLANGSYPTLRSALLAGDRAMIYFDLPGRRETEFLGKPVQLADGIVRLAFDCDVPVVPLRMRRKGHSACLDVGTPLEPRDHGDPDRLQAELARRHGAWILEEPGAMEDPGEFGWDDGATPESWTSPRAKRDAAAAPPA